jgi:drug/metabolite transporter (DMT)-like permease
MLTVFFGLTGALVYGSADFIGGMASKRISALKVTAIGGVSGLVVLALLLPVLGGTWSTEALVLGTISGISGSAAIALLYRCLAVGPMSILSPLTAIVSAIVPLIAGLVRGERFESIGYLALVLALVAIVLVGFVPDRKAIRPTIGALGMAVASGALIGVFLIVIDLTPADSGIVPLVFNRATSATILFATVGVLALVARARRRRGGDGTAGAGWHAGLILAAASGIVDASANILLLLGIRLGDLSVMSVLTALYPAGTVILAAVILKERISVTQAVGLVLAITAASMLALA